LLVERLAIADAALQELRPIGNDRHGIGSLWQERPKLGMMPAQLVAGAVPVRANGPPQPFDFGHQLVARHLVEFEVHVTTPSCASVSEDLPVASLLCKIILKNRVVAVDRLLYQSTRW
jgi:hypothetical protein